MKRLIMAIFLLTLIPLAMALEECKEISPPSDIPCRVTSIWDYPNACNTYQVNLYDNATLIQNYTMGDFGIYCDFTFNYSTAGTYYYNISSGDTGSIVVESDDTMASLAITVFILLITGGVFILPFVIKKFSQNKYLDATIKGLCICMGLFLLSLDTAMIATIADEAGLGISSEIFRYLWLINWAAYIAIVFVVLSFGYKMLTAWNGDKKKRSMGEEE